MKAIFCFFLKKSFDDGPAKTRGWTFGVSRKSEIRYFSAVAAPGSSLKIPDIVFFEIHPKSGAATFGRAVFDGPCQVSGSGCGAPSFGYRTEDTG